MTWLEVALTIEGIPILVRLLPVEVIVTVSSHLALIEEARLLGVEGGLAVQFAASEVEQPAFTIRETFDGSIPMNLEACRDFFVKVLKQYLSCVFKRAWISPSN